MKQTILRTLTLGVMICAVTASISAQAALTVFMTSENYTTGDFGGLAGADANCQRLASNAGFNGTFIAWLSDSTTDAASRFSEYEKDLPWVRVDGATVANNFADLTDGSIQATITVREDGTPTGAGAFSPWTGTNADGTRDEGGNFCNDWTSASVDDTGLAGRWANTDSLWTEAGTLQCNGQRAPDNTRIDVHALLCFEVIEPLDNVSTLSYWSLLTLILMLGAGGYLSVRRHRVALHQ